MDFQTQVNTVQAPAVAGDFCDANPRATVDAGPGGLVAGPLGISVARFVWADPTFLDPENAPTVVNNYGNGVPVGFVHRDQQALITQYLSSASNVIPHGFGVTAFRKGGFWVTNAGTGYAQRGQKAYAKFADGSVRFGAAGAPTTAGVTGAIAPKSSTITGSILGNVMTVTAAADDPIVVGSLVAGVGVNGSPRIVSQLSGTDHGVGTYALDIGEQNVAPGTSLTATYGLLTVSAVASGTIAIGGVVAGAGVTNGTSVRALGTGVGNIGTYYVDVTQTVNSEALTITQDVETDWQAVSSGGVGEIVKMTNVATL